MQLYHRLLGFQTPEALVIAHILDSFALIIQLTKQFDMSRGARFLWNRNLDLGWIWAGLATIEAGGFMFSWAKKNL